MTESASKPRLPQYNVLVPILWDVNRASSHSFDLFLIFVPDRDSLGVWLSPKHVSMGTYDEYNL